MDIGTTPEGRTMIALVVSKDRAFTPEAAAKTNKAVIMIQSGIHAGEIEGKDTVLMLIRDMTVSKKFAAWLDHAIFVVIPVFNVDGHEYFSAYHRPSQNGPASTGLRATAQRLNLNRDYMKADTPEMKAWLRVFNSWMPDFLIDNHVTDGSDMQYDVTWDMARNQDIAEPAGAWVREKYVPELDKRMAADGHMVAPYGALRNREFFMEVFSPRYSHLYSAVQNRPSLLVETHSLKTARTRAWANYDIMRHTFDIITADAESLRKAVREADRAMSARAGDHSRRTCLSRRKSERQEPPDCLSRAEKRALQERSNRRERHPLHRRKGRYPNRDSRSDRYHASRANAPRISDPSRLQLRRRLFCKLTESRSSAPTKPLDQVFETYRFTSTKFAANASEGHVMLTVEPRVVKEKIFIPAGSYWIPMKQRRARLILSLLEPNAPDSIAAWGLLDSVFEGGGGRGGRGGAVGEYLSEPIARRMMADQPELRKQFEQKLASDQQFAADPRARLQWWFEQSKYQPEDAGRYPIVRVWEKNW